jgi:hypothetical protein
VTQLGRLAGVTLAAGALLAITTPTAHAAPPIPFTITQQNDFTEGGVNTFTASEPLCPSGTFVEEVVADAGQPDRTSQLNILIRTVYTCNDGSGTFFALKNVFLTFEGDGATNDGLITLHGGTGDYVGLNGHGHDNGFGSGDFGEALITGVIVGS